MKTADVPIPVQFSAAAEKAAKRLGISTSRFCALAIKDYVRRLDAKGLTARINKALRTQDTSLDPVVAKMQFSSLEKEEW